MSPAWESLAQTYTLIIECTNFVNMQVQKTARISNWDTIFRWMKHENIIEYYASERHSTRGQLQYWLITDYYSKGNLQEFLIHNTLKWNEFCDMAASIAKGKYGTLTGTPHRLLSWCSHDEKITQQIICLHDSSWNVLLFTGLAYLHSEHDLTGHEKLPVAHRDIKSCNILVKEDGFTCVLADFGLSLKLDPTLTQEELANAGQSIF